MSIFDNTPAGALVSAIELANARDCQNARRVQTTETYPPPGVYIRAGRALRRVLAKKLGAFTELRSITESRSSPV
jgi:hypothetical protein